MCLGIPGQIIEIKGNMGTVQLEDTQINVGLDLVPEVVVGEHVLVHAGFAMKIIDRHEALVTWQLIKELFTYEEA